MIFLIWFWLINLALLFGIELDAEIERTKELKEGVPRAEKEIQLDAREDPKIDVGFLGADLAWDDAAKGWRINRIARGDGWDPENAPPLLRPGVNVPSTF